MYDKQKKIGIAVLGSGKAGKYHLYWYSKNRKCKVIGIYNRTKKNAVDSVKKYGTKYFNDWKELVANESVDIVSICTPSRFHCEQAVFSLKNNCHVLCEKPMAPTVEKCSEMIKESKKRNKMLSIMFNMRVHPVILKTNEIIGDIGDIFHIYINFPYYRKNVSWRHLSGSGGGVLMENISHMIDLVGIWMKDKKIKYISNESLIVNKDRELDDQSLLIIRYKDNSLVNIYGSYNDFGFYGYDNEAFYGTILGTKGKIVFIFNSYDKNFNYLYLIKDGKREEIEIDIPDEIDEIYPGHLDSFGKVINNFVKSVLSNSSPLINPEDGLKTIEIVSAAYMSEFMEKKIKFPLKNLKLGRLDFKYFKNS
jgi:predicted dehydrogenase